MSNVVAAPGDLDLWLAVAAGPGVWTDDEDDPGGLELLGGLLIAVVAAIAALPFIVRTPNIDERTAVVAAGVGVALGAVLLCVVPLSLALGHNAPGLLKHRPYVAALLRVAAAVGFIICWLALMPTSALPLLAFLGVAVGGEGAVTARSLGLPVSARLWIRRFAGSWVHLGFLTGVLVMIALDPARVTVYAALGIMLVAYAALLLAVATSRWVDFALNGIARRSDLRLERYAEAEDRRRSHWLHDDVLGMLTGVQMRLEREQWDSATTAGELRWLDHQLRLRQAEEIVRSGTATIGEIVQPYLRHAQNMHVTVTEVPAWETASVRLGQSDARRVQRVFGVAVPNALAAGTTTLAFRVRVDDGRTLVVELEDDAGGFDPSLRISGRGLDSLERELPPGSLEIVPTGAGTLLRAAFPVELR